MTTATSSLWWPGDHRAGDLLSGDALLRALTRVEQAWLDALVGTGTAPEGAAADLDGLDLDPAALAVAAERSGNPVVPLVQVLRERLPEPSSSWVHRGLTSQDVLDTAVMLCARDAVDRVRRDIDAQVGTLATLGRAHRDTPMVARTLTRYAVPTTFGLKAAGWLVGVLDADDDLADLRFPVQLGGAAGTLAGPVEVAGVDGARALRDRFARTLALEVAMPWHTTRATVTRIGDAAVRATDAWGHLANDVLALGRPEVGELSDGSRGGSSAMPHKANPVLAILVRRAAVAAPALGATLHQASAAQVDERADGAWHVEWDTLATLLRRTVVAAGQTRDLLDGLEVHTDVMRARLDRAGEDVRTEQGALAALAAGEPAPTYDGLASELVDEVLLRVDARRGLRAEEETS